MGIEPSIPSSLEQGIHTSATEADRKTAPSRSSLGPKAIFPHCPLPPRGNAARAALPRQTTPGYRSTFKFQFKGENLLTRGDMLQTSLMSSQDAAIWKERWRKALVWKHLEYAYSFFKKIDNRWCCWFISVARNLLVRGE